MKDTIRELYYWQISQEGSRKKITEQYEKAYKEYDIQHQKITLALKEIYGDKAISIEND